MSDKPIRKIVKPSVPGARIPDPAHPGLNIAQAGTEVTMDHGWILRERRGEVVVSDVPEAVEPKKAPDTL